jgi:hypothetical protein
MRVSFAGVEYFTAKLLQQWEAALLTDNQDEADRQRKKYLGTLEGLGWTEQERDTEVLKLIDREWLNIYRRATFRLAVTSHNLH